MKYALVHAVRSKNIAATMPCIGISLIVNRVSSQNVERKAVSKWMDCQVLWNCQVAQQSIQTLKLKSELDQVSYNVARNNL